MFAPPWDEPQGKWFCLYAEQHGLRMSAGTTSLGNGWRVDIDDKACTRAVLPTDEVRARGIVIATAVSAVLITNLRSAQPDRSRKAPIATRGGGIIDIAPSASS